MYITDSDEVRFWSAEAEDMHQWRMFVGQLELDVLRRDRERDRSPHFALRKTYWEAEAIFAARYYHALMQLYLARHELTTNNMWPETRC